MDIRREAIELDKVPEWLTGSPRMYSTLVPVASEWALPAQVRILFLSSSFFWRHGPVLPRHVPSGLVFFVQFARAKPCLLNLECVRCVQFALPSCRECRPRGLL